MDKPIDVLRDYLPESLLYIMTIVSPKSALTLVKRYGGSHLTIPNKAKDSHFLAGLIGMDDFSKLCAVFSDCPLDVPKCSRLMALERDIAIFKDYQTGISQPKLAVKYGLTERAIRRILSKGQIIYQNGLIDKMQAALAVLLSV